MELAVKQRLIGAAVLAALAMIFLPMLLQSPDVQDSTASQVPLTMPAAPEQNFETRELVLPVPSAVPEGGALASPETPAAAPVDPNAVVTVDASEPATRASNDPAAPVTEVAGDGPALATPVDAATGQPLPVPPPATIRPATTKPSAAEAPATPAPAVVPAAPAPAPLPASTAGGQYMVNVGSFGNLANARTLESKLRAAGLPVRSETLDVAGKPAQRLRIGPYAERAAAEAARLRAQTVTGTAGQVIALDAGAAGAAPVARTPAAAVGFAVQLGALRDEADAIALRDKARAAGFVAFHQRISSDNGVLYRVRVGPEADRPAAEALRIALAAKLGVTGVVVSHP